MSFTYLLIIVFVVLIIVAVMTGLWVMGVYNNLVILRNRFKNAWSQIDVQLKRRYDLIPNLVNAVKGYAKHEKEVFQKVTEARTAAISAEGIKEQEKAENELSKTLKSIFAVAENYPALRANENFLELQGELSETENKIEASRRFYNANVRELNIRIQSFPSNTVANAFKFEKKNLFEIEASQKTAAKEPPKVEV